MAAEEATKESKATTPGINLDAVKDAWNGTIKGNSVEQVFDERWERSAEHMTIMLGAGLFVGGVVSTLLFRGGRLRALGTGFGAGCGVGSSWTTIRYKIYGDNVLDVAKKD